MSGKSLEQIWQKIQEKAQAQKESEAKMLFEANSKREAARQQYLKDLKMYEQIGTSQNLTSITSAGGTVCIQYTTYDNTVWIYPQVDINTVLAGTTYSYTTNGDDLIFEDLATLVNYHFQVHCCVFHLFHHL